MFKEAKTVENVEARNYALTAAEAMETAELHYNHISIKWESLEWPRVECGNSQIRVEIWKGDRNRKMRPKVGRSGALTKRSQNTMGVEWRCYLITLSPSSLSVANGRPGGSCFYLQMTGRRDGYWRSWGEPCASPFLMVFDECRLLVRPHPDVSNILKADVGWRLNK